MIHARSSSLDILEPLLMRLRLLTQLKEKSRGIFYIKSRAFLHFHEDAEGLFADVSIKSSWTRFPVKTQAECEQLLEVVKNAISASANTQTSP